MHEWTRTPETDRQISGKDTQFISLWANPIDAGPPPVLTPTGARITLEERYAIVGLKKARFSIRAIARELGRAPSTISRELRRNVRPSGYHTPAVAQQYTVARRRRSRRHTHFSHDEWALVEHLVALDWSPEQVSGWLKLHGVMSISHETIYLRVWHDRCSGGDLWSHMRQADKRCRRRYRGRDSRARLPGKRHISERPAEVEGRATIGHREIDTIKGDSQGTHSALTVVERTTGYLQMGKLERHCAADATARTIGIIKRQPERSKTITADNGTVFHSHKLAEDATGVESYFATPYHSWQRSTNENTNGLIRRYLPKTHEHGACHPSRPGRDRSQAQHQAGETAELQDTGGMLCTIVDVLSASVAIQT